MSHRFNQTEIEISNSVSNEESFEENYEDLVNFYISQRHNYSASLPLPIHSDLIIDQILLENQKKQIHKENSKFQLKQQILQIVLPSHESLDSSANVIIEASEEFTENMKEIIEVTSSAEQSPTAGNSIELNFDFPCPENNEEDLSDSIFNISQEIK